MGQETVNQGLISSVNRNKSSYIYLLRVKRVWRRRLIRSLRRVLPRRRRGRRGRHGDGRRRRPLRRPRRRRAAAARARAAAASAEDNVAERDAAGEAAGRAAEPPQPHAVRRGRKRADGGIL